MTPNEIPEPQATVDTIDATIDVTAKDYVIFYEVMKINHQKYPH